MKKMLNEMIEDEAELGSDNEENDDNIKKINEEDEKIEAGIKDGENLDDELKEIIDNQVQLVEEDEQFAQLQYLKNINKQDNEEIQQIIQGKYKGQKARRDQLVDLDNNDNNEERFQRI